MVDAKAVRLRGIVRALTAAQQGVLPLGTFGQPRSECAACDVNAAERNVRDVSGCACCQSDVPDTSDKSSPSTVHANKSSVR